MMLTVIALLFMAVDCLHRPTIREGFDLEAYLQERESRNAEHAFAASPRSDYER
jgi:hypothetical protein